MKLGELLSELKYSTVSDIGIDLDAEVSSLCYDSRKLEKACVFVAIVGANSDGHTYAKDALEAGAALIVTEHETECDSSAPIIRVKNTREALALLSSAWFGFPARELTTVALTGTKGKSTTANMIREALERIGIKTGIMGTIGVGIGDKVYKTSNTTPESYIVQQYLRQMVDEGCRALVMEVSSQALKQYRVGGIMYDYALFTNLEPDHIGANEHASFEEYMYCKSLLFRQCRCAIGNADDAHFDDVVRMLAKAPQDFEAVPAASPVTVTFGCESTRDYSASNITLLGTGGEIGIGYELMVHGVKAAGIKLSIPGRFNVYNSLAAAAVVCEIAGCEGKTMAGLAESLYEVHVLGRLEPRRISDRFSLMIDYAHNAMALESLLKTLLEYSPKRLVCLFGCGGNRSKERRYEMGEVSAKLADLTVVTSDNPRFEKPMDIIDDILVGIKKGNKPYVTIPDRRDAIRYVIENAQDGDVIVLAGKGQEDYQEIEGVKYHMDEREIIDDVVRDLMKSRGYV